MRYFAHKKASCRRLCQHRQDLRQKQYGPCREKTCLRGFANNIGADQPAHPRSLISAFVNHFLECIISRLSTSKFSYFLLVSVAEQAGLNLTLSDTP